MIELHEWIRQRRRSRRSHGSSSARGPTFDRRDRFDLGAYNIIGINHVVRELHLDVAHVIDIDVVADCADAFAGNCDWLLMPRRPHERSEPGTRRLEDWFAELPVLRELDERAPRLVQRHHRAGRRGSPRSSTPASSARKPCCGSSGAWARARCGPSESTAVARTPPVRAPRADHAARQRPARFDVQFDRLREIAGRVQPRLSAARRAAPRVHRHRRVADGRPPRARVLDPQAREHPRRGRPDARRRAPDAARPGEPPAHRVLVQPVPDPGLCGYEGRALYLDADMLVFGDLAELCRPPFGDEPSCAAPPIRPMQWQGHEVVDHFGARLSGDAPRLRSAALEGRRCRRSARRRPLHLRGAHVRPSRSTATPSPAAIPREWNHLEEYDPASTRLLHYTVVPTQPWKNDTNPLRTLWEPEFEAARKAGVVHRDEALHLARRGHIKPSLMLPSRAGPRLAAMVAGKARLGVQGAERFLGVLRHPRVMKLRSRVGL